MRIQHNIAALNSHRQLGGNNSQVGKNLEKLSSGFRINRAGDDAAGLAISEKMRAQIKGLETASKNANDGISLIQTAEGALTEVHSMLNRMVELATQSANGTYGEEERNKINSEVQNLKSEIDRIAESTNFNGINLLDGSLGGGAIKSSGVELTGKNVSTFDPASITGNVIDQIGGAKAAVAATTTDNIVIDFTGATVQAGATTGGFTLKFGTATVSRDAATTGAMGGASIAAAFSGATVTIDGKLFTATVSGGKVTFVSAASAGANDSKVEGTTVTFGAAGGTITGDAPEITAKEGQDVGPAVAAVNENASDTFTIDGQTLKIDWKNNAKAKAVFDSLNSETPLTKEGGKEAATKLTNLLNDEIKRQGLKGSVKVTSSGESDGAITFKLESSNKGANSSVGWVGNDLGAAAADSLGTRLFSTTPGQGSIQEAGKKFDGALTTEDSFMMNINGTQVEVKGFAAARGDTMESVATSLKTQLDIAIGAANSASGATGADILKATDFKVDVDKNGGLSIKYTGTNEDLDFSFEEKVTEGKEGKGASLLGLTGRDSSSATGGGGLILQVGDTNEDFQKVTVSVDAMSVVSLGLGDVDTTSQKLAGASTDIIKAAIEKVSTARGELGALQNRLDHTINNLGVTTENMTAAESRVRDVDMAKEMMDFTKNNILVQASQAMLAQANQLPQGVLQLLQ